MGTLKMLKEKGWHLPEEKLPLIVKGTEKKNYNPGMEYPVQVENWLESEPVLVILKGEEARTDNIHMARLTGLRMEYYDDESGVKLDEEIEPEDWYMGISGIREEEHDFCSSDSVLAWRELDDLI